MNRVQRLKLFLDIHALGDHRTEQICIDRFHFNVKFDITIYFMHSYRSISSVGCVEPAFSHGSTIYLSFKRETSQAVKKQMVSQSVTARQRCGRRGFLL